MRENVAIDGIDAFRSANFPFHAPGLEDGDLPITNGTAWLGVAAECPPLSVLSAALARRKG